MYLAVTNFAKHQHYRNRKPPWVKFYVKLADPKHPLNALPIPARYLFDRLLLLAAEWNNAIPNDFELIAKLCVMPPEACREALAELEKGGWIKRTRTTRRASKKASESLPPETETDREKERPIGAEIVAAWLAHAPPLIQHHATFFAGRKPKLAIQNALKVYTLEDVQLAIEAYATVIGSDLHYFTHRWTLPDFLNRGLDKFVTAADPLTNFLRDKRNGTKPAPPPRPVDEVLDLPDISEEERLANLQRLAELAERVGA